MESKIVNKYLQRFFISMVAYMITIMASVYYLTGLEIGTLERFIAVTPMIPIVFGTISMLKAVGHMDEFQQKINHDAMAFSAIIVGLGTFSYGFLEGVGFPRLQVIWILPALILFWGLAKNIIARRYR